MIFVNSYPEDEEWTAYIKNLNEWTPEGTQLRHIVGYIQSGPHYPKHMHQDLIKQWVAHQRQSEWDRMCSILRGMGVKFDGKEAYRIRKEHWWDTADIQLVEFHDFKLELVKNEEKPMR